MLDFCVVPSNRWGIEMMLSLLLSVYIRNVFFFIFQPLNYSLARWTVSSFSSSSISSSPSLSLLVWRPTRPPIGDYRHPPKGKKGRKSCCQTEPTKAAIYLTMATVDSKGLSHDAPSVTLMAGKVCRHIYSLFLSTCTWCWVVSPLLSISTASVGW